MNTFSVSYADQLFLSLLMLVWDSALSLSTTRQGSYAISQTRLRRPEQGKSDLMQLCLFGIRLLASA